MSNYNCPLGCNVGCEVCENNHYAEDNQHNMVDYICDCKCHKLEGKKQNDFIAMTKETKIQYLKEQVL